MVHAVTRASLPALLAGRRPAGHVIDCVGLTGDFRSSPAGRGRGPCRSRRALPGGAAIQFFLLLSSTRVYGRASATHEDVALPILPERTVRPVQCDETGRRGSVSRRPASHGARGTSVECLWHRHAGADVPGTGAARGECHRKRVVPPSRRVSKGLCQRRSGSAAAAGNRHCRGHRIYNVAAGSNTSHAAIARCLRNIAGWHIGFAPDAPTVRYPPIDTTGSTPNSVHRQRSGWPICRPC